MFTEEPEYVPLRVPDTVERIETRIGSDGYWLDATLYRPKYLTDHSGAPGVVMSHGWGGGKNSVAHYAVRFAKNDMVALTFSHDGWFGSSGRVQILDDALDVDADGIAVAAEFAVAGATMPGCQRCRKDAVPTVHGS